ncbi:MAG: HAMP domain-containing histidine kinase [Candidatus Nanopelagicales bacterium]|jgi:two-component system sensor histidine kinase BaeS|nr:HAMP domain-containing histidine kinase [Candidatus Nanopelagicales bacterium]
MSRGSLARRLPLAMAAVAAVAVLIAALVAWPLLTRAAESSARATLSRTADLTTELVERTYADLPFAGGRRLSERLAALLAPQQVTAYLVGPAAAVPAPLTEADVAAVTTGGTVSDRRAGAGGPWFVEGRTVADGVGVLLVQPSSAARELSGIALARLLLALALGLTVAAVVGVLLARRITRPLGQAAGAATAMAAGDRDVRVDPDGPQEVADLAVALNGLAAALAESEGRQREFFLTVSHELRTPLTSIKGYAEALADGVVPADAIPAAAGTVRAEADHLDRLVADLLDLARLGAVDVAVAPVDLDLAALGAEAASAWAARSGRAGVRFVDEVDRTPLGVRTDPVRVRQIVDNLMENALRVSGDGAVVVLRIGSLAPGWFQVEVRDDGPGLSEDDRRVAFEPGVLHARYRGVRKVGSGVGLALVARLAERLGGRAEAGIAPEGGASFRAVLPTTLPSAHGAVLAPQGAGTGSRS